MDTGALILEKLNEYKMMAAPLERAQDEVAYAHRMLRARVEDELESIAPVLGALAEALHVSTLDLLLAQDRFMFVEDAVARSGLTIEEIRSRLIASSSTAREDLRLLGIGESLSNG